MLMYANVRMIRFVTPTQKTFLRLRVTDSQKIYDHVTLEKSRHRGREGEKETVGGRCIGQPTRNTEQCMYVRGIRVLPSFPFFRLLSRRGHCYFYSRYTVARMICEAGGAF